MTGSDFFRTLLGRSYSAFLKAAHLPGDMPFVELDYYKRTWLTKDLRKVNAPSSDFTIRQGDKMKTIIYTFEH